MTAPAKLTFVSNLFTSKIFLTQAVSLVAIIASAAGVHVLEDQATQMQVIGVLSVVTTVLLRWMFPTGPVSITAPVVTPASQDIPAGVSVVTVPAQKDQTQTTGVTPLAIGNNTVEVHEPPPKTSETAPATVTITN